MEDRAHALAAGLFALILGAASMAAVWWFTGSREATAEYELVSTGSITGLNVEASVRYRGMAVGKVTRMRIDPEDPRNILVGIRLPANLPVTRGTRASLGYQGVTGLAFIQLDERGDDPVPLTAQDGRPPRLQLEPGLIDQLTDTATDAMRRFREVADQLGSFFDEANVERFRRTLERLESAADGVDQTFAEAPQTLAAIRAVFSTENVERLSAALAHLERAGAEAAPTVAEARATLESMKHMMVTLEAVAGAAGDRLLEGTLPHLNALLKELADTSGKVGRLVEEIEASPQVLITGRSQRRAGPGEAGFAPGAR